MKPDDVVEENSVMPQIHCTASGVVGNIAPQEDSE